MVIFIQLLGSFFALCSGLPVFQVFILYLIGFSCLNTKSVNLFREFDYYVNGMALPLDATWPKQIYKADDRLVSHFRFIWIRYGFYLIFFS